MTKRTGKSSREKTPGAAIRVALVLVAAALGCARHTEPVVAPEQMRVGEPAFAATWEATKDVLRDYRFELDRQDRRAGVITTDPLLGRHGPEFWRKDAATQRDVCEGTLQTVYRTATVEIIGGSDGYEPVVRVEVARSDRRTPQVSSTSEAFSLFRLPGGGEERSRYLMGYEEAEEAPAGGLTPLGRDETLEQQLAADIRRAAGSR
jgi:hypothetical protein